ncbi:hypothetical protein [Priestia sp. YIM B13551]
MYLGVIVFHKWSTATLGVLAFIFSVIEIVLIILGCVFLGLTKS